MLSRGSLFLAAASLASSGLVATTAAPAAAAPLKKCTKLVGSVTIKPGLTTVPKAQTATAKGKLTGCKPTKKTGPSGVITASLKLPADSSCQGLATGGTTIKAKAKIKWKSTKVSNISFTAKTGTGSNATVATIKGKVTKGLFKGRPVTAAIKFTPKAGQNCTPGHPITKLTFKQTKPWVIK
jgi:hypothetical protein